MPNAIKIIKRDHRAVNTKYLLYKGARSESEKKKIAKQIFDALDMHAKMEEEFFYPVVQKEGNTKARNIIENAFAEHAEMKVLIGRFRTESGDPGFDMKIDELLAGVMHHVKEEEKELLPEVEKSVSDDRLEELGILMDPVSPSHGEKITGQITQRIKAGSRALTS